MKLRMTKKELLIILILAVLFLVGIIFVFSQRGRGGLIQTENLIDECQMSEKECRENPTCRVQEGKRGEFITCCPVKRDSEQREECLRVY